MRALSRSEHLAAWLCGAGILLGAAGFWAMRHVPLTPEEEENERVLQQVAIPATEEIARQQPNNLHLQAMLESLRQSSIYNRKPPLYRTPGIVAFAIGVGSLLAGAFIWLRAKQWRLSWIKTNEDV